MTIGIEAERANHAQKTGVEHYAKQLILHLSKIDHENQYVLYLRTKPQDWFFDLPKNFKIKVMPFPIFWTQIRISLEMLMHRPDVLFIPASSMPIIHPKKTVVTVHDLAFMYYPEMFTTFMRYYHRFEDWLVKKFAWKIIAIAESTKKDFLKFWGGDASRISVIYHGYDKMADMSKVESGKSKVVDKLPEKYVAFLATLQPRKNISGLIEAMKQLRAEMPELPHKLVIAGKQGWRYEGIIADIEANKDFVIYLGHIADDDRFEILRRADCLVLPSFYEGFGMQILEAFEVGIPVATSNISSMPEVAGPAAVYFDPTKTSEIKNAIKNLILDRGLHDRMAAAGREQLQKFSWDKCARETLAVLTSH